MPMPIDEFLRGYDELWGKGDVAAIERYLLDGASSYREAGMSTSLEFVTVLNELGGWYRNSSRYAESEECFREAIEIMEAHELRENEQYTRLLVNIAGLYRLMGHFDDALVADEEARAILERLGVPDKYAYASILNSMCLIYIDMQRLDDALAAARAAADYIRDCPGIGDHEIATSRINIASVLMKRGELDEACSEINAALAMYDAMPQENVHHAAALQAKAVLQIQKRDFDGAVRSLEQALALTERFYGKNAEYETTLKTLERLRDMQSQG